MAEELPIGAVVTRPGSSEEYHTGGWRIFKPIWDESKCIQCMICWQYCPDNAIPLVNKKRGATDLNYCKGCGICAAECPVKCITMEKEVK